VAVLSRKEAEASGKLKSKQDVPASVSVKHELETAVILPELPPPKVEKRKLKFSDPWFYLQHPDCTDSFKPECTIEIAGERVEVVSGRVETQVEAVRAELCRQGWRWMNEVFR
jgi:hypothetical protein